MKVTQEAAQKLLEEIAGLPDSLLNYSYDEQTGGLTLTVRETPILIELRKFFDKDEYELVLGLTNRCVLTSPNSKAVAAGLIRRLEEIKKRRFLAEEEAEAAALDRALTTALSQVKDLKNANTLHESKARVAEG